MLSIRLKPGEVGLTELPCTRVNGFGEVTDGIDIEP